MKTKKLDAPEWFFMWTGTNAYVTTICGWTRAQVMNEVEKANSCTWKLIYGRGGRIIRCTLTEKRK